MSTATVVAVAVVVAAVAAAAVVVAPAVVDARALVSDTRHGNDLDQTGNTHTNNPEADVENS